MKKHVTLFLTTAVILTLTGCSTFKDYLVNERKENTENEKEEQIEMIKSSGEEEEEKEKFVFKRIYGGEVLGEEDTAYYFLENLMNEKTVYESEDYVLDEKKLMVNNSATDVKIRLNKIIKLKDSSYDGPGHIVGNFVLDIGENTYGGDYIYLGQYESEYKDGVDEREVSILKGKDGIDYILVITRNPGYVCEGDTYAYIYNESGSLLKKQWIDRGATSFSYKGTLLEYEILDDAIIYYEQDWKKGVVNKYELTVERNEINKKLLKSYDFDELQGAGAMT